MVEGRLGYNQEQGRYGLLVSDLWEHPGLHCGECLEVQLPDGSWTVARMEMDNSGIWYLVGAPYRGEGLEYVRARL